MPPLFLSHDEVCELTAAHTKSGQIQVLKREGIRHTIKRNGWPCVTWYAVIGMTGQSEQPVWQPRKA